jgi:hypothetical protein
MHIDLHISQINVLNFTQTFPNPNPCGAPVPQFGHIRLHSRRRNFFNRASGVNFDILMGDIDGSGRGRQRDWTPN